VVVEIIRKHKLRDSSKTQGILYGGQGSQGYEDRPQSAWQAMRQTLSSWKIADYLRVIVISLVSGFVPLSNYRFELPCLHMAYLTD
jgi:hypothetical protein